MGIDFAKLDIMEYFRPQDAIALVTLVQRISHKDMLIAEVGGWKGYSTAYLASCIQKYGGMVYAIDHWQGNEGTWSVEVAQKQDIYKVFESNLRTLGLWEFISPMRMDSLEGRKTFKDNSLDMVFIDADHRNKPFKADLENWWAKVKIGGIICGHDCEAHYTELPEEQRMVVENKIDDDFVAGLHPGIIKTLYEQFADDYSIMPNSTVWYKQKGQNGRA